LYYKDITSAYNIQGRAGISYKLVLILTTLVNFDIHNYLFPTPNIPYIIAF